MNQDPPPVGENTNKNANFELCNHKVVSATGETVGYETDVMGRHPPEIVMEGLVGEMTFKLGAKG